MKRHCRHLATLLAAVAVALSLDAGVSVRWTAETSRVQPQMLDAWRGDTLDLECTLVSYGQRVAPGAATASFMWQTNGMGTAWWQTNATISAEGVIAATWSPSMDPGGAEVAFFMPVVAGDGASYRAAGRIRFRPSPGAGSRMVELPQPGGTIDFGDYQLVNAPWATLAAANEAIAAAVTSATGALVIPPAVDLGPYATTGYVAGAITSATGELVIPPPPDLTPYATTAGVETALQDMSNSLERSVQAVSKSAMPRAEMASYATLSAVSDAIAAIHIPSLAGYATEQWIVDYFATNYTPPDLSSYATTAYADAIAANAEATAIAAIPSLAGYATESYVAEYFATNYTPPDLSSYASRSYADAAASNAQAAAIAAIPSLAGYATEQWTADYFAANYTPPDLSSYASRAYADAAASNAQAAAIAAIPSLAGYATETYAQNAAEDAASDALSAAQSYARDLSWAASQGNTRLVSIDGTIWQDATGTVWQVSSIYGWSGTVIDMSTSEASPIVFYYAGKTDHSYAAGEDYWSAGAGTNLFYGSNMGYTWILWFTNTYYGAESNSLWFADGSPPLSATNIIINTSNEFYSLFFRPVSLATNPVDRVLYASDSGDAATADRALSIGTHTRWTDATGCVWEVGAPAWISTTAGVEFIEWTEITYGEYEGMWDLHFVANGDGSHVYTNAPSLHQSITVPAGAWWYHDEMVDRGGFPVSFVLVATTNLVGRVALTNDLPGAIISTISDFASTGTIHAAESSTYSSRLFDASYDSAYDATYLIRESTNAAVAVAAAKQDALPYPTNAIPYAAISGAPSGGGQEWRVVNYDVEVDAISFVTNGMANLIFLGGVIGGSVITNGWPDGASMFVRGQFSEETSYIFGPNVRLVGYGTWPTNNFQSVWWRSGTNIFVNILVEE